MGQRGLTPDLPIGAGEIVRARLAGMKPALPVIVSFVGMTPWEGQHVFAKPGKAYDWGWTEGLQVAIVTAEGLDPTDAIRGCFWPEHVHKAGYPTLIDVDLEAVSHVVATLPRIQLWHESPELYFPKETACKSSLTPST